MENEPSDRNKSAPTKAIHIQDLRPVQTDVKPVLPRVGQSPTSPEPRAVDEIVALVTDNQPLLSKSAPLEAEPQRKLSGWWRRVGGGSLLLSLLIHAAAIVVMACLVTVTMREGRVDFLPGGGSKGAADASKSLAQQTQQKKQRSLSERVPMQKVVSMSDAASISLPDIPAESLDLPDTTSLLGGGAMSAGGFGSAGIGGGFGSGNGTGGMKGFTGSTFFGKVGGDGLPGVLYDLKQTPSRQVSEFENSEGSYAAIINKAAAKHFSETALKDYYKSTQKMSFTFLAIPNIAATEGPKAFHVENEVKPSGWFVHYGGTVVPPKPGDWRFVGFFDDAVIVYINGKAVFDGSWYPIVHHGEKNADKLIRQDFGGPAIAGSRHAYMGKWVHLEGATRIDIVVGERPGGRIGGMLMIQRQDAKYRTREDGSPILPVFATARLDNADVHRLQRFEEGPPVFEVEEDTPVFQIRKPLFSSN